MAILSHPAFGPKASLAYITVGALIDVWTGVWYFGFARGATISDTTWFWLVGLFLTGVVLMAIGFFLGPISQFARRAELPPGSAADAEAAIQQTAAANPQPVVTTAAAPAATVHPTPAANVPQTAGVVTANPPAQATRTTTGGY